MQEIRFEDVERALEAREPEFWRSVVGLAQTTSLDPAADVEVKEGAQTYRAFRNELNSWSFKYNKSEEEQQLYRATVMKELEESGVLPDRLLLHRVVRHLWESEGAYERDQLLSIIENCPIGWGPWKGIKQVFKEAEEKGDFEILGAISARLDEARAGWTSTREVSGGTMKYMVLRGWRALRKLGQRFPSRYPDAAVEFLRFYPESTNWSGTWIANQIMYHEADQYESGNFWSTPSDLLTHRAFAKTWQRTPRPLFTLLERAQAEKVRKFAVDALKTDFRTGLREVETEWVVRLMLTSSATTHGFAIWLLDYVPRFEQSNFKTLGLHEPVLGLLESPSKEAAKYAASYARTHARDMAISRLLVLVNSGHAEVRKLAVDFLGAKDPRKEVGLEAWTSLLGTSHGHSVAQKALEEHFGAGDMTKAWFVELLMSENRKVVDFATSRVFKVHGEKSLGSGFFTGLFDDVRLSQRAAKFALESLEKHYDFEKVDEEFWRRGLLHSKSSSQIRRWVEQDKLPASRFGVAYWKSLATHMDWESDPWVSSLKESTHEWAKEIGYNTSLGAFARGLLNDVRQFAAKDVGIEWWLGLAQRMEEEYREFAHSHMIRALAPADFAPEQESAASSSSASAGPVTVDLEGQTFVFTGELATMTRKDAQAKVDGAGGANAKSVTGKLDYLVVGDKGSALFGQGKKGSKILKAEKLQASGKGIKVISETAFLQMLVGGGPAEVSEEDLMAGCERLWEMVTSEENDALQEFAIQYVKYHHLDLGPQLTERQVDPGMEIPREFLDWERVGPLFEEERIELRRLGIELGRWELARWSPPLRQIVELCEQPYANVTKFFKGAFLAKDIKENKPYRLGREHLDEEGVYRFCESSDGGTRQIGMALIAMYQDLAKPEALFRLTESHDRQMRAFVIRTIWALYRDRGITMGWKPESLEKRFGPAKTTKEYDNFEVGEGPRAKPQGKPAEASKLRDFLRRILFEIPPARPSKEESSSGGGRKISAREAKLSLIEVMRDLALEELAFAKIIAPLVSEFMHSRGKSEREACLVALVQLAKAYPEEGFLGSGAKVAS